MMRLILVQPLNKRIPEMLKRSVIFNRYICHVIISLLVTEGPLEDVLRSSWGKDPEIKLSKCKTIWIFLEKPPYHRVYLIDVRNKVSRIFLFFFTRQRREPEEHVSILIFTSPFFPLKSILLNPLILFMSFFLSLCFQALATSLITMERAHAVRAFLRRFLTTLAAGIFKFEFLPGSLSKILYILLNYRNNSLNRLICRLFILFVRDD